MDENKIDLNDIVAILERTPASLAALLEGLPDVWITATEGDNTWSPYDVIGHLIHGERTDWIPRVNHILMGDARPFPAFDRTAQFTQNRVASLSELLAEFSAVRQESIATLLSLNLRDEDFSRTGQHPDFGTVTLGQLLATWVVHDLDHISQIARTMAKVYMNAVGPWQAYLSILRDRQRETASKG